MTTRKGPRPAIWFCPATGELAAKAWLTKLPAAKAADEDATNWRRVMRGDTESMFLP